MVYESAPSSAMPLLPHLPQSRPVTLPSPSFRARAAAGAACTPPATHLPHLDGLRAVALCGVLCFHADLPFAPRGYLGVDAFLVLSGFLMTRGILRALQSGVFGFAAFYRRRFWRLYPSALATAAASVALSFLFADSDHALETCQSALAAMALVGNVYWYGNSSYFANEAGFRPLLHMWSLSLEEQFYLVWPAVLVGASALASRVGRPAAVPLLVAAVFLASYAVMLWFRDDANFVFYLLPARIFQFAAGGLVQLAEGKVAVPRNSQTLLSTAALALLLFSFSSTQPSDTQSTLLALAGTSALIATPAGIVNTALLSSAPLRLVGRFSYAAYLTHWPLWVFSTIVGYRQAAIVRWGSATSPLYILLHFAATGATAHVLHNTVETPMRFAKLSDSKRHRVAVITAAAALTATAALSGHRTGGWPSRFVSSHHQTSQGEMDKLRSVCVDLANVPDATVVTTEGVSATHGCLVGGGGGGSGGRLERCAREMSDAGNGTKEARWVREVPVRAVVVGNSFARHLSGALEAAFVTGPPFLLSFRDGCTLVTKGEVRVLPTHRRAASLGNRCRYQNERWWELIEALPKGSTVVYARDWRVRTEAQRLGMEERVKGLISNLRELQLRLAIVTPVQGARFSYVCNELRASEWPVLRLVAGLTSCPDTAGPRLGMQEAVLAIHKLMDANSINTDVLDVYPYICPDASSDQCNRMVEVDGRVERLYAPDLSHLSYLGSRALGPAFRDFFTRTDRHLLPG